MKKLLLLVFSMTLVLFFTSNAFAQKGTVKVASNNELINALNNPDVKFIEITQDGFYDELLMNAKAGMLISRGGEADGSRAQCFYGIQPNPKCFDPLNQPPGITAGYVVDTASVGTTADLTCPPANSGVWTVVSQPPLSTVNFLDPAINYTMAFEANVAGSYLLRYTWGAPYNTHLQTEYFLYGVPVITDLHGNPDTLCGLSTTITFDYDMGFTSPDTTVVWTLDGHDASSVFPMEPGTFPLTVTDCGAHTLTLHVENSLGCGTSDSTIELYFYDEPVVNAGMDGSVCGFVYDGLAGSYTGALCDAGVSAVESWEPDVSFGNPGTATFSAGLDSVTVTACGEYQFVYKVVNGLCEDMDTVAIYFYDMPDASAGADDEICGLTYDALAGSFTGASCFDGVTPVETWELDGSFMQPGAATFNSLTSVTVSNCGQYQFVYKVVNGDCTDTDTVAIYFYDMPVVDAGMDASVCGLVYTPLQGSFPTLLCTGGVTPVQSWEPDASFGNPGTATFSAGLDSVTVTACGEYQFVYKVVNGLCTDMDTVAIYFYDMPDASAGPDADICGLTYDALAGSFTGATCFDGVSPVETWVLDGSFTQPGGATFNSLTSVTVSTCGTYQFVYTVENGDCTDTDTVAIAFYDTPVVDAGQDADVCGITYTLLPSYTVLCNNGVSVVETWSVVSAPPSAIAGFVGNVVTVDSCGPYVFMYKVTNGPCADSATVQIDFYDTPVVTMPDDDTICGLTTVLTASHTEKCGTPTVLWTKVNGPGVVTFNPDDADVTTVAVDTCGTYEFMYTVTNGPCVASGTVFIDFVEPPVIFTDRVPEKVCGFVTDFDFWYEADCAVGDSAYWSFVSPGATITQGAGYLWDVTVTDCGDYTFTYTAVNGPGGMCSVDSTITISFYEIPVPNITGNMNPYTCSTEEYCADDTGDCNDILDLTFEWTVAGGLFDNGLTTITSTGNCVNVNWDHIWSTPGTLSVHAFITGLDDCGGNADSTITKQQPTLEGQVKYWNVFETYMPTPYATDDYQTIPFDYFYVTLYRIGDQTDVELETVYVQPRLMEDLNELMSYFDFVIDTELGDGCEAEYYLKVWDGGMVYHDNPPAPVEEQKLGGSTYTYNNWGGVNATDALAIQLMAVATDISGMPYNYTWVGSNAWAPLMYGYYSHAIADVNSTNTYVNGGITALDALTAKYRAVGLLGSYPHNGAGNNQFSPNFRVTGRMVSMLPQMTWDTAFKETNVPDVKFVHSGNDYQYFQFAVDHKYSSTPLPWEGDANYINLYYEAIGDINASYVPPGSGLKAEPTVDLTYEGVFGAYVGEVLTVPVNIDRDAEVGAITLSFNYRNDLIEVLGTNYADDAMFINQEEGILNMAWFSMEAVDYPADAVVGQIKIRILEEIPEGTELFSLNVNTELADATANPIEVDLKTIGISTDKGISVSELSSSNYPNPFSDATTISYMLPESGSVKIDVYNNVGMLVTTLVDGAQDSGVQNVVFNTGDAQDGVYFYHITLQGETKNYSAVKRMIVVN